VNIRRYVSRSVVLAVLVGAAIINPLSRPAVHAASTTDVSIALNWIKNVEFGGIWAAQEKGWWSQAGLQVSVRSYDDGYQDPVLLVGAGKYQFGFQDGASIILGRAAKVPVKAIWASGETSPFAFITMPKSGITSPKDFKGKRIGYQSHEKYVLDAMLNAVGLKESDVSPVVVQYDPTVLLAGKVDAYLAYLTNEPIELAQKYHVKVNIIPASAYGYNFYSDVLFTTDNTIKSNPALVRTVVSIMDRGWKYALAHPAEIAKVVVPKLDPTDSISQQQAEMSALAKLASQPGAPTGSMTAARWKAGIDLLLKYKQITTPISAGDVFTTLFLGATH
jgi:ABC-type nitrate/sulfonate/bicarbonate transport system substrate-binding protein